MASVIVVVVVAVVAVVAVAVAVAVVVVVVVVSTYCICRCVLMNSHKCTVGDCWGTVGGLFWEVPFRTPSEGHMVFPGSPTGGVRGGGLLWDCIRASLGVVLGCVGGGSGAETCPSPITPGSG